MDQSKEECSNVIREILVRLHCPACTEVSERAIREFLDSHGIPYMVSTITEMELINFESED